MNSTGNLKIGWEKNFEGYFEETKKFAIPVLDKNNTPVSLVGSTVTMKTWAAEFPHGAITNYTMPGAVLEGVEGHKLLMNVTSFVKNKLQYEIKIILADTTIIKGVGIFDITGKF